MIITCVKIVNNSDENLASVAVAEKNVEDAPVWYINVRVDVNMHWDCTSILTEALLLHTAIWLVCPFLYNELECNVGNSGMNA